MNTCCSLHLAVPGSPTITNVFPQSRSVLVIFTQPSGSVDSYVVEVTSTDDDIPVQRALTVVTTVTSINGLEEALDYIVTVTAVNGNGRGEPATYPFRTLGSSQYLLLCVVCVCVILCAIYLVCFPFPFTLFQITIFLVPSSKWSASQCDNKCDKDHNYFVMATTKSDLQKYIQLYLLVYCEI